MRIPILYPSQHMCAGVIFRAEEIMPFLECSHPHTQATTAGTIWWGSCKQITKPSILHIFGCRNGRVTWILFHGIIRNIWRRHRKCPCRFQDGSVSKVSTGVHAGWIVRVRSWQRACCAAFTSAVGIWSRQQVFVGTQFESSRHITYLDECREVCPPSNACLEGHIWHLW